MNIEDTIKSRIERLQQQKKRADVLIAQERKRLATHKQDQAQKEARED